MEQSPADQLHMIGELPKNPRDLWACIGCGLLQSYHWWEQNECPNCHFPMDFENTISANFTGMMALYQPSESWCAQWMRYHKFIPGLYCLSNNGEVTRQMLRHLMGRMAHLPSWVEVAKDSMPLQASDEGSGEDELEPEADGLRD